MRGLKVGDIVQINSSFMGEPVGVLAYIYETYQDFDQPTLKGVSVITKNGKDLGGFSVEEQKTYLQFVRESGVDYEFKNVLQLDRDWAEGKLQRAFK